ncbi:alpha-glucosidase [Marinobacter lacisalsi]|uniref:Alpha-glucosidase n=1 Tax=Marinobacter lacisalsi TaxID=475979 RepID=A0ABV8QKQ5_9GAMM
MQNNNEWWRGAVIYQVYPRSFFDSNDDGIGDLPGVTAKMDYIASLNVDAIWLSPFFTSPMKDFGYDVADYRDVDPIFGTLDDFGRLIDAAHTRGLKVMIDQVFSHTSDQHAWFKESRQDRTNPKADWYQWADPMADGTPPNNWVSVFGGSAWAWESRRKQYYLHNFLASQPDLNFHNPEVVDQVLSDVRFWLDQGVDGFRLDAINFCFHDPMLRNNPPSGVIREGSIGVRTENPYAYQLHQFDKTRPENLEFLKRLRRLLDEYPGTTTVGEVGDDNSLKTMAEYTRDGDKLHMAYSFDLLTSQSGADFIRNTVKTVEAEMIDGWPCWAIGNHDVTRVASRWQAQGVEQLTQFMATLLSLRGSVCLYQGEELGLQEAELAYEDLMDPYGINFWPEYKGRDGCRTPLPWQSDSQHGGFSAHKPWLPVATPHLQLAIDQQEADPDSLLHRYREFLALRRLEPALRIGDIRFLESPDGTLLFKRRTHNEALLVGINFQGQDIDIDTPSIQTPVDQAPLVVNGKWSDNRLHLPPFGVGIARIAPE